MSNGKLPFSKPKQDTKALWVIIIFNLIFVGAGYWLIESNRLDLLENKLDFIFSKNPLIIGFLALVFFSYFMAFMSGWFFLSRYYKDTKNMDVDMFYMKTGIMKRMMTYSRCLNIGVNKNGLRLSILPLFRWGHPPLFIPWSDIAFSAEKFGFIKYFKLEFKRGNYLKIPQNVAREIFFNDPKIYKLIPI